MTDSDDFAKRLSEAFQEEASEILADVRKLFSLLESTQHSTNTAFSEQLVHIDLALARLHSLKGSARAVSEQQAVTICQWLETALSSAKAEAKSIDRVQIHALSFSIELLDELLGLTESEVKGKERIQTEIGKLLGFAHAAETQEGRREQAEPAAQEEENTAQAPTRISIKAPSQPKVDNLTSVRVSIEKLDRLLSESEELLTIKTKAAEYLEDLSQLCPPSQKSMNSYSSCSTKSAP